MSGWGSGKWGSSGWGHSILPSGHIPISSEFPSADVPGSDIAGLLDYVEVNATRGAPWIQYDPAALGLRVMNDGGAETAIGVDLETSESWTLEVTFRPDKLPPDLNNLDTHRLFIGAYDMQGPGCGLAISRAGLAIMPTPIGSAFPIPGSQSLIPEGSDYYTVRIAVSAELDVTNIYVTKTSLISIKGHQLRFATNAIQSPPDSSDGVIIDPLGTGPIPVQITLQTVRFNGHSILIPNQRPVAVPGPDQGVSVGATVRFDGSGSYDPEGSPLTYFWSLIDAPDDSQFKISGTDGSTSPDFNSTGFTYFLDDSEAPFGEGKASVLQPGDTLIVGGQQYTIAVGVAGQIPMWFRPDGLTKYVRNTPANVLQWRSTLPVDWTDNWSDTQIAITEELLPDNLNNQSWVIYHSATFFDDQTHAIPEATPDAAGLYEPQLVVNDGELDSISEFALLNVAQTSLTMGVIPDVSFIWNHLSNFWNLLEDREKVDIVQSGFAQAAANILMTAWQIDYNKSLKDLQRVFQRRWLKYSTLLEDDPNTATIRIIRSPIIGRDISQLYSAVDIAGKTLEVILDNGRVQVIEFVGTPSILIPADEIVRQINDQLNADIAYIYSFFPSPTLEVALALKYPARLLRISPHGTANSDLGFSTTEYTQNSLLGPLCLTYPNSIYPEYKGVPVVSLFHGVLGDDAFAGPDLLAEGVTTSDILIIGGVSYNIRQITRGVRHYLLYENEDQIHNTIIPDRPVVIVNNSRSWIIPSIVTSTVNNFSYQLIAVGDLASFEVTSIATNTPVEVLCSILAVTGNTIGFDPAPLLLALDGQPENFTCVFSGIRRVNNIPVDTLVVDIPRLQEVIKDPPGCLTSNKDYIITRINGQNAIQFVSGTYSIGDPPSDTLWAEVTYLDNRPAVEANFGTLVAFTSAKATAISDSLDYLSAVRGLWYAYFDGPSIENIRIGIQILLGLPFAEEEAVVDRIDAHFSILLGRIFLRDVSNPAIIRGYFYPTVSGLGLAINQNTRKTIEVHDKIAQFAPLSTGVEVLDWLRCAEWVIPYSTVFSEVEKFFRFAIRANVDAFEPANLTLAIDFMLKFKPHYTYPIFIVLKNISPDTIDVVDEFTTVVRKLIVSTPDTKNIGAYRYDDDIAGEAFDSPHGSLFTDGECQQQFDAPYFGFDQPLLFPDMQMSVFASDSLSGIPRFDSIWAYDDGGGTDIFPLSGPAPTLPPPPYGPLVGLLSFDMGLPGGLPGLTPGIYSRGWYL